MSPPEVLVFLGNGMPVVEVAGPLDEVNLLRSAAGEQPKYLIVFDDLILKVLAVFLGTLPDLRNQLRERR